ncbi:type IA DNA topoisomerase [Flexithrix dorotheae]|uniref:type IA DNA topoisomerase n=1 Tax=Flexithrix dorotheae TaxID=70993 RepID=UPI000381B64C|nr:type IA DNA topoisomerase [Flexithrix dorotheae]
MKVVIAEKPSVARDIAKVIGAKTKKEGYLEGEGYFVTWAFGHLVQLENAKAYGYTKWDLKQLPILPEKFKLALNGDSGAIKQFNIIKELFQKSEEIIVATDAGREGELIFRYIYQLAAVEKPFQRLWISSLTTSAIKKGFANLKAGTAYDNLFFSGASRSEADWMVGINATIAFTLSSNSSSVLSLGRVQTPVLVMICERYLHNKNFVPEEFFVPQLVLEKEEKTFKAVYKGERIFDQETAQKVIDGVGEEVTCTNAETKPKTEKQPLPYDLTSLQADCNQKLGFSAQKTLDLLQVLYERKWITYPRTDSRYITKDIYTELPDLFGKIKTHWPQRYEKFIDVLEMEDLPKRCVNDEKVTDHHAILPTGEKHGQLNKEEGQVFDIITRRAIGAFSGECKKEITTYTFEDVFASTGTVVIEPGWRLLELKDKKEEEGKDDDDENQDLPSVENGEQVKVEEKLVKHSKTKAKPVHTESSLLKMMETAGKEIDDEELAKAIKDSGIGTPATRASIIETLLKRTYIERQKKKLVPTSLGLEVYGQIKKLTIGSPELTGTWENKLNKMAQGEYSRDSFIDEVKGFSGELVEKLKELGKNMGSNTINSNCPKCGKGEILEGKRGFGCAQHKEGCDFVVWKTYLGKRLTPAQIRQLIESGKTKFPVKGLRDENGKVFEAVLKIDKEFKVIHQASRKKSKDLVCPKCFEATLEDQEKLFKCRAISCDFVLWKKVAKKTLTQKNIQSLLDSGETELIKGFTSRKETTFDAVLKLDGDYKVAFKFN